MENRQQDCSQKSLRKSNRKRRVPELSDYEPTTIQLENLARRKLTAIFPDVVEVFQSMSAITNKECIVTVRHGKHTIIHRYSLGTPFRQLKYLILAHILHSEERHRRQDTALLHVARIVGFQSIPSNIPLDYRLSIGNGELSHNLQLQCLCYSNAANLSRYIIIKCLAIGGFSKVYLVRSLLDGRFLAMKIMDKRFIFQNEKESVVENEKSICSQLDHPFVVRLEHSFETRNFTFFVMEYCPGGELFYLLKRVKRMDEADARFYFTEILYGLQYLHEKGIVYRDLKPENLLIGEDGHIKIADFGLSKTGMTRQTVTYSYCGSAQYMPPEMILRSGHGFGVDYYTLGALLYELVTGLPPYYSRDETKIRDCILYEPLAFPEDVPLSEQLKSLLVGLLNKNHKMRLGCLRGIKQILFHPWMGKVDGKAVLNKQKQPPHMPNLAQLNFDEEELGEDERQFTARVFREVRSKESVTKYHFPGINFESNCCHLSTAHRRLLLECTSKDNVKKCNSLDSSERGVRNYSHDKENRAERLIDQSPYLQRLMQSKHSNSTSSVRKHYFGQASSQKQEKLHNQTTLNDIKRIYWPHYSQDTDPTKAFRGILIQGSSKRRALQNLTSKASNASAGRLVPLNRSPKKKRLKVQRNCVDD